MGSFVFDIGHLDFLGRFLQLYSMLYQDEVANWGICVWHLLVYDFFVSNSCDYQVNIWDTDVQLGFAFLKVMML